MIAMVPWPGRPLGAPLSQLDGVDTDEQTAKALGDWHYWVGRGYGFS